jgi:uncharacterized protein YjbJ (UPF0337 family)
LAYGIRCIPFRDAEWCPGKYAGKHALNRSPGQQIKLENPMNWDQIEGSWKQAMAKVKQKWAKLTDDDVLLIRGKRDQLVGKIQER